MLRRDTGLVLLAGLCLLAAFVTLGACGPPLGSPSYLVLVGVAAAAYGSAMCILFITRRPPAGAFLILCLVLAAACRVPLLMKESGNDVKRYLWDARAQQFGYNPYLVVPADPMLARVHTEQTRRVTDATMTTPYPPGAQILFRLIFSVSARTYAFKMVLTLCELAFCVVLWRWLAATGLAAGWLIAYAWNPLAILETAGEAHLDLIGVLFLMASVLFLTNGRRRSSVLCFAVSVAIKPLPIVLVPLFWRRVSARDAATGAALFMAMYVPFFHGGHFPAGSIGTFIDQFRFNQTVFGVTSDLVGARAAAALAVAGGLVVAVALRSRTSVTSPSAWAWPMAVALVMAPVVYPWYLVWLTPFLTSLATLPLLVWSLSILSTYVVWHLQALGGPWTVPTSIAFFEFGLVVLAGAAAAGVWQVRGRRARAMQEFHHRSPFQAGVDLT